MTNRYELDLIDVGMVRLKSHFNRDEQITSYLDGFTP